MINQLRFAFRLGVGYIWSTNSNHTKMKKLIFLLAFTFSLLTSHLSLSQCPADISYSQPGIFWNPDSSTGGWKRLQYQPPAGTYKKIHLAMDVKIPYWYAPNPSKQYQVFWLVRDGKNSDMFGYVGVYGPNTSQVMLRHGWNMPGWAKAKIQEKFKFITGRKYHFDYTYDAGPNLA